MVDFINEFMNGQRACDKGLPCPADATKEFKRGYGAEYEMQQIAEHNPQLIKKVAK